MRTCKISIQSIIEEGIFLDDSKIAKVTPTYKAGDNSDSMLFQNSRTNNVRIITNIVSIFNQK